MAKKPFPVEVMRKRPAAFGMAMGKGHECGKDEPDQGK
jgi:hypothetical protein